MAFHMPASALPPKVMAPRQISETNIPVLPNWLNFMADLVECWKNTLFSRRLDVKPGFGRGLREIRRGRRDDQDPIQDAVISYERTVTPVPR